MNPHARPFLNRFVPVVLVLLMLSAGTGKTLRAPVEVAPAAAQGLAIPQATPTPEAREVGKENSGNGNYPREDPASAQSGPTQTDQANSEPLRFTFPTPAPAPDPGWRPAQYPVPWALTSYDHFYFTRPFAADEAGWARPDYRYGGVFFEQVVHSGVDISAEIGTPVLAAGPGKVTWSGYGFNRGVYDVNDPYGMAVFIRHDFGYQGYTLYTLYAHLDRVDVVKGQWIEAGSPIGLSGQTGKATGPHLHFEVRFEKDLNFSTRNPELWIAPPQGWGVLAGRVMNNSGGLLQGQPVEVVSRESGQAWQANSYTEGGFVESDAYYQENLVVSDLPAGRYDIQINLWGKIYTQEIDILPGRVSTFSFRGRSGFTLEPPVLPGSDFVP